MNSEQPDLLVLVPQGIKSTEQRTTKVVGAGTSGNKEY